MVKMMEADELRLRDLLGTEEELPDALVEVYERYVRCRHRQVGGVLELSELCTLIVLSGADQIVGPRLDPLQAVDLAGFGPIEDRSLDAGEDCLVRLEDQWCRGRYVSAGRGELLRIQVEGDSKKFREVARADVRVERVVEEVPN